MDWNAALVSFWLIMAATNYKPNQKSEEYSSPGETWEEENPEPRKTILLKKFYSCKQKECMLTEMEEGSPYKSKPRKKIWSFF